MNAPVNAPARRVLKVAILGLAHVHTEGYISILKTLPGVELLGCAERDGIASSRTFEGVKMFSGVTALLEQRPDAVIICSETVFHRELVERAARAGAHILCEKPIATTLEDARIMQDACHTAGVNFMTAFPMRFDITLQHTRQTLQEGSLGAVLGIVGVNHSINPSSHDAWFADPILAGGGAVMDHTVHLTDLYRWFFKTEILEVYAALGHPLGSSVETSGILLVTLENGLHASIDCSWSRPAHYPRWGHLKMEIVCEKGVLVVDPFADHLTLFDTANPAPTWVSFAPDPNRAMLLAFLESVQKHLPPPVTWLDGYRTLQVALSAYTSSQTGQLERITNQEF